MLRIYLLNILCAKITFRKKLILKVYYFIINNYKIITAYNRQFIIFYTLDKLNTETTERKCDINRLDNTKCLNNVSRDNRYCFY